MSTIYRIAFAPARKPLYWTGLLFKHKNGDFGAISVTEQSVAALISKAESHILKSHQVWRIEDPGAVSRVGWAGTQFPTPETIREKDTSFRRNHFWDRLGTQGKNQPLTSNDCPPKWSRKSLRRNLQGANKAIFIACHSGKLRLAYTSPNVISMN